MSDLEARIAGLLAAARECPGATDQDTARSIMAHAVEPELAKPCEHPIDLTDLGDFHLSTVMRVLRAVGMRLNIDIDTDDAPPERTISA